MIWKSIWLMLHTKSENSSAPELQQDAIYLNFLDQYEKLFPGRNDASEQDIS